MDADFIQFKHNAIKHHYQLIIAVIDFTMQEDNILFSKYMYVSNILTFLCLIYRIDFYSKIMKTGAGYCRVLEPNLYTSK